MGPHAAEVRRITETLDVAAARRLWRHMAPHLHQPANDHEMLLQLHYQRTQMKSMPLKLRVYSDRWLVDHGYPTAMPDKLRALGDRLYPRVVEGVGISVAVSSEFMRPVGDALVHAQAVVVADAYNSGPVVDPVKLKAAMEEARLAEKRRLLGSVSVSLRSLQRV